MTFQPASPRVKVSPRTSNEVLIMNERSCKKSYVAVIHASIRANPVLIDTILNFKMDIGRDIERLDGRQIGAIDFRPGQQIGIGQVDRPDSCTGADIEHSVDGFRVKRSKEEATLQCLQDLMLGF